MTIGQRIKERRKALKMSADEMGARLGKDRSTIYRYEKGDIENLPLDILEPIAEILQTTPQYLMGWEEVQKKNDTAVGIVKRLGSDKDFCELVKIIYKLDSRQIESVKDMLISFVK